MNRQGYMLQVTAHIHNNRCRCPRKFRGCSENFRSKGGDGERVGRYFLVSAVWEISEAGFLRYGFDKGVVTWVYLKKILHAN
ncbi:hypothetical protein GBA52_014419 [Prunus armeniaca]|nr:hypothetical protein GBA52_014419 [Prunus armeniaca]